MFLGFESATVGATLASSKGKKRHKCEDVTARDLSYLGCAATAISILRNKRDISITRTKNEIAVLTLFVQQRILLSYQISMGCLDQESNETQDDGREPTLDSNCSALVGADSDR